VSASAEERARAALALGRAGLPSGTGERVRALLSDSDSGVRVAAAAALLGGAR
jgi:HEAT repeat protein